MVFGWMSIQPLGFLRELGVFIWSGVRTARVTPTVTHGLLIFPHTKGVPLGLLFSEFLTLCLVNSKNTYTCSQINPIWGKSQLRSCPVLTAPGVHAWVGGGSHCTTRGLAAHGLLCIE